METRPRVMQRHRNPLQNRLDPFQGSGFGVRGSGGGIVRESGGTGVFHPRIVNPTTTPPATTDVKRKQGKLACFVFIFGLCSLLLTSILILG